MAKRIVCCPGSGDRLEYLYVDTSCLLVENITDKVSVLVSNAGSRCCFDALAGYAFGEKVLSEQEQDLFSFDFFGLHSFELFKNKEELRLKTGSDKILHSCLLNYYRREYDGTQQHTFFAEPSVDNTYVRVSGGVEHELTLESRELVKNKAGEEVELETLDKGKSLAEREAEAEKIQAELAEQEARADADAKAAKKEKQQQARKAHQRLMEEERYREFRNQDNVQAEEYRRFRQYEEEMRQNNAALTAEYNQGNYASLPGYIAPEEFAGTYETHSNETLGIAIDNHELYSLASRFEEFEVPYTVGGETLADGRQISCIYYSSDYVDRATSAKDFFELEKNLYFDEVVSGQTYYNAFQLSALEYAYENNVDTHYVANGDYNGNQMFRILDAGLNGYDMATVANPAFTPAHMDALCYYMSYGWDTKPISDPAMAPIDVADRVMQEEFKNDVSRENTFFSTHDYNEFLAYQPVADGTPYFNNYDSAQQQRFYSQVRQNAASAEAKDNYEAFKDNLHSGYLQRQAEMHYLGYNPEASPLIASAAGAPATADAMCKYIDPDTGVEKTIPRSQVTPELVARCEKYWSERAGASHQLLSGGGSIPYNVLNDKHALAGAGQARYTINGYVRSDASFAPYAATRSAAVLEKAASSASTKVAVGGGDKGRPGVVDLVAAQKAEPVKKDGTLSKHEPRQVPADGNKRISDLKVRYQDGPPVGFNSGSRADSPVRTPVSNKMPGRKYRPLDDLKVRSDFARKAGLKIQTLGGKCVSVGIGSARNAFSRVTHTLGQNDETNSVSAYRSVRRVAGNTLLVAQLVGDVPRQFMRVGQGISYAGNSIKNLDRRICGNKPVALAQRTISSKQVHKEYLALQDKQFKTIHKKYGADAAKMNIREVNRNIKFIDSKKNGLIKENQALKKEIKAFYDKKGLSKSERALLKDKLDLKKKNDVLIKKHFSDIKKLNELKELKLGNNKALEGLKSKQKKFGTKEARWRRAGGVFVQSLISQLHKAGADNTMGGMATASSFVMNFVRNPVFRIVRKTSFKVAKVALKTPVYAFKGGESAVRYIYKKRTGVELPTLKNAVKNKIQHSKAYHNVRSKRITANRKRTQKINARKELKKKVKTKVNSKLEKKVGKKTVDTGKRIWRGGKKAGAVAGKIVSAPFKAIKALVSSIGKALSAAAPFLAKAFLVVVAALLVLLICTSVVAAVLQLVTAVFPGETDSDGRVDMSSYVDIINDCQEKLQDEIDEIASGMSSSGEEYDNVYYDFNGVAGNNAAEIFSMLAVRSEWSTAEVFMQEASKAYIEQLYADSNYFDYVESDAYFCDNGCEVREYKCYDTPDEYATETRNSLYKASDHSDEEWVAEVDFAQQGCKASEPYSCTRVGHATYNPDGCQKHNNGEAMDTPCSCRMYKTELTDDKIEKYYCLGYCPGKHVDYSCPGHTEQVCYGKHRDITFTITSLGFDDIFAADSYLDEMGGTVRGEAYEDKFVISAYCSCHECCHPYDPACTGKPSKTASGTTPKANYTLAVDADNPVVPLGTHVWIDGKEYVVEDTGALADSGRDFDMYFDSHEAALQWGVRTKTVYKSETQKSKDELVKENISDMAGATPYFTNDFAGWTEENRELAKTIYESFVGEDADEIYAGMDDLDNVSYGTPMFRDYNFDGIVFDDVSGLTNRQQQVLAAVNSPSIAAVKGRCQAWVADVYQAALGGGRSSQCCANHAGEAWGVSKEWSEIQVGATVYGYSSSIYGHVGIYIGNGMVAHNIGYVKVQSLESWLNTYNGQCWGWNGGVNLTGNSKYNCEAAGTFMKGKDTNATPSTPTLPPFNPMLPE